MQGKIMKGIAGFYYVHIVESGIYECKAKGLFRKQNRKPLVGDVVEIDSLNEEEKKGNIIEILPRKTELIRPAVANVDQALVIFSATKPKPNYNLLDRFLIAMDRQQVQTTICFNKIDLATPQELEELKEIYEKAGYPLLFISAKEEEGLEEIRRFLKGKTTTVAGPSGVGKSTIINLLQEEVEMETGTVSRKIDRGKHTTRHSQLIYVERDTYIVDTPGFSSMYVEDFEKEELASYFHEFEPYEPECKFIGCSHIHEPKCGVKRALEEHLISRKRYEDYCFLYEELKDKKRY